MGLGGAYGFAFLVIMRIDVEMRGEIEWMGNKGKDERKEKKEMSLVLYTRRARKRIRRWKQND